MTSILNAEYWSERYLNSETGWDVGEATPPIKQYLDQIQDKQLKILVPGAGNAYEAAYAFQNGFLNTHILDISPVPIQNFKSKYPEFPEDQVHLEDFFAHKGTYDLIVEQTFFCALDPRLREDYVSAVHTLLSAKGKLVGLLFDREFAQAGPPFGGNRNAYERLFSSRFNIRTLESCLNSIPQRMGAEVFVIFERKDG